MSGCQAFVNGFLNHLNNDSVQAMSDFHFSSFSCNFFGKSGVYWLERTTMKTIAIVFLSLIAAILILPVLPLALPILIIGSVVMLPLMLILAIGTGIISLAVGVAKLAVGVISIGVTVIGVVLIPLILFGAIGVALWSCLF